MTAQLTQARRIASLRERRSERERRDATLRLHRQTAEADAAQSQLQRRTAERAEAERLLIANPADPQAQLWRMLSCQQEQGAARTLVEAEALLITARGCARAAQVAHDRTTQRAQLLDQQLASAAARKAHSVEERAADELQGRRS